MTTDTVPQAVLFPDLFDKPLFAKFNQEQASGIPVKWNSVSGDLEHGFRRSGTLVGA